MKLIDMRNDQIVSQEEYKQYLNKEIDMEKINWIREEKGIKDE